MADEPITEPVKSVGDNLSYRIVVSGLVIVLLVTVAGMIALPLIGKEVPTELSTVAIPIVTALAAILSPVSLSAK